MEGPTHLPHSAHDAYPYVLRAIEKLQDRGYGEHFGS
jgi:hypothetical protein